MPRNCNSFMRFCLVLFALIVCSVSVFAQPSSENSSELSSELEQALAALPEQTQTLESTLEQQQRQLKSIDQQRTEIETKIDHVHHVLTLLNEQGKWLSFSTELGSSLREQLLTLPKKIIYQPIDTDIAELKVNQLHHNNLLNQQQKLVQTIKDSAFSNTIKKTETAKVEQQIQLIKQIINQYDTIILNLTRLKIGNEQLNQALNEVSDATHRYFFWVANVPPIKLNFIHLLISDLTLFISIDTSEQLLAALQTMFESPGFMLLFLISMVLVFVQFKLKSRFTDFIDRISNKVGKVTIDRYRLTLEVIAYSLLMAIPFPFLWACLGYGLQLDWHFPVANAIGYGVNCAAPILWIFMISARFAAPKGLFIVHFGWDEQRVRLALRYYKMSIWGLIPLIIIVTSIEYYNNQQFAPTIGRLCFILLCLMLVFMSNTLHRAKVPLYIDKHGLSENLLNRVLWFILLVAPWLAIIASVLGYLSTSEALLGRLEASVAIWLALLMSYFLIRRGMWIKKRKIEFERAKQKRLERSAQRAKNNEEDQTTADLEEPIINLDEISAQSLHLVRSVILMIALICMIVLWSELHSAFSFMENIKLWVTTTNINGVESEEYITLSSIFISILTLLITVQLVKNLPSLLELVVLQHLDLAPGSGYAIITLTKYTIILIGGVTTFSFIGLDWSKIQWLIAALGVGLGFGLQEIFANFISGLIMLFEKPIRIGDTVTIRNLTGKITKINTRATTIVDWDRKEIVMPNKAFITEQLVNWSLSDGVTRITLSIPATIEADSELVTQLLLEAANECELILDDPSPEVFLVDIQAGIQIFEIRLFAAEIGHRMQVRDQVHKIIIKKYHEHHLTLPYPPLQTNFEALGLQSGRRVFSAGSL